MINIINLTPHPLIIYDGDRKYSPIPSSGIVRVSQKTEKIGDVADIPVYQTVFGSEIEGLPEPFDSDDETRVYVVSRLAAEAIKALYPARRDVYVPGTAVRDGDGQIIGCEGLSRI